MNRAEANGNAVPRIDRSNAQGQLDQLRFGEVLACLVIDGIGNMGL